MEDENSVILPDLSKNKKQGEFVYDVLDAARGASENRYLMYGGGVASGKSVAALTSLLLLCLIYPGSRWAVFRASNNNLEKTTLPSIGRLLAGNNRWKYNGSQGAMSWTYENGSKILFISENFNADPDLNHVLGLEINGAILEEAGELSEKLFDILKTRIGRWKLKKMPSPLIILTCNPSQNWTKTKFYVPWRNGDIQAPLYFKQALVRDNIDNLPNAEEYLLALQSMPERERRRLVDGEWVNFVDQNSLFAYSFSRHRHVVYPEGPEWLGDRDQWLWLSCDQNKNPLVTMVFQHYGGTFRVLDIVKISNGDVYKMAAEIRRRWSGFAYKVTGDASGYSGNAAVSDGMNYYRILASELDIPDDNFEVSRKNPDLIDNGRLVNAAFEKYDMRINSQNCEPLVYDLENCRVTPEMKLMKKDRNDPAQQADALDCLRYGINCELRALVI